MRSGAVDRLDWRSASAYDYLDDADPADIAWEFLRRNPIYREEYHAILTAEFPSSSARQDALAGLAARWGLRFRGGPDAG